MRIAHVILVHANPEQLRRLIDSLEHPDADFYIHVDAKSSVDEFMPLIDNQHVFLVQKRAKVIWGSHSTIQATLNGYEEILKSGRNYDYINLLSGQDYPLKSTGQIHQYLENNPGKAFMETLSIEHEWQEAIPRITKYHLIDYQFPGNHKIQKLLNRILPERKMPNGLVPVGRSLWITITPAHAAHILKYLKENPRVERFFKLTWGGDEIILQTLLYNSEYQKDIVNNNLRYIDWSEGNARPRTFTDEDLPKLLASDCLFARKFRFSADDRILETIDQHRSAESRVL